MDSGFEAGVSSIMDQFTQSSEQMHEKHTNATLMKMFYRDHVASRKRTRDEDGDPIAINRPPLGAQPQLPQPQLPQAGFLSDRKHPVSPRSEQSYKALGSQFDSWIGQLERTCDLDGGVPTGGTKLKSKGLSISVPHAKTLQQATHMSHLPPSFPHPPGPLSSLLPPPSTLLNETNSGGNSGGNPSSGLLGVDPRNVFGTSLLPSPSNAAHLLDGFYIGRPSIGILGLDLPTGTPHSALKTNRERGRAEVYWPGQEGDDDEGDDEALRPEIDLMVQGKAINLGKEKQMEEALQPAFVPSVVLPPPLLTPSSDLGGSLIMGISGVAVGTQLDDKGPAVPLVPFPGFLSLVQFNKKNLSRGSPPSSMNPSCHNSPLRQPARETFEI